MSEEREPVTFEEAEQMIGDGERIHTFRNPAAGVMLGCDWDRADILDHVKKYGAELSGPSATAMKHGLVLMDDTGPLFIETVPTVSDRDPVIQ